MRTPALPRADALDLVLTALVEALRHTETPVAIVPSESTKLMGTNAALDSVGLVSVIVAVERGIEARTGIRLELADSRAMSRRPSPFRSAGTLADFVTERLTAL